MDGAASTETGKRDGSETADRITYRVVGNGPPLVLVHGLAGSGRWWRHNIEPLSRRFRVFVVDLPGFGGNRRGPRCPLSAMPALLAAWLDQMGLERAALVGHSMGGRVVAELAADAPERVARLVLVDAAIGPGGLGLPRHAVGLARALRRASPAILPILAADAVRADPRTLLRASHALLTSGVEAKLSKITAPTLVVWGERDAVVPVTVAERITDLAQHARLVVIPGGDHAPMWSRPNEFNALVLDFLTEPEPDADDSG